MMKMPENKKALTLLEIIVSVMILALVTTGVVNVFISGKQFIQHSRYRMSAAEIGRLFIDPLQYYIRQDTWTSATTNCFQSKNITQCPNVSTSSSPYTASYSFTDHMDYSTIKRVVVTVNWTE